MIIYDKAGLHNIKVLKEAAKYQENGLISKDELSKIKYAHPSPFYTPNLFVRAGFFILTCIISFFGCGFLSLLLAESGLITSYGWFVFLGILNYVALEVLTKQNRYYKAGVDDALQWISGGLLVGAFVAMIDNQKGASPESISVFVLLVAFVFTLRFTDMLAAVISYLAAFALIFFTWQKVGDIGVLTMPFVLIAVSATAYVFSKKGEAHPSCYYYTDCLVLVQVVSLVTLYLSGNYYVVKEAGDMLNGTVSKTIPLAWFFWFWTIALPFLYIAYGVRQKSLLLIRTGLLLIAAAVFTFRNYYHVLPIELALTIGGALVVGLAWFLVRFLSTPKAGFTSKDLTKVKSDDELNAESLVVGETFTGATQTPQENIFGGGQFGGGGSSSGF